MDFRGRMNQATGRTASTASQNVEAAKSLGNPSPMSQLTSPKSKLFRVGSLLLLFSVTALVIALTFLLAFSSNSQQRAVAQDKYQAVFLNNGQVYFGKISKINGSGVDLRGIYYLQTSGGENAQQTATANSNVSLVKLGCELHAPYDRMIINGDQVLFWENIQDSGQVVKAIDEYKKQNAGKQNCSQQSQNSTQQAPASSSAEPATGTGATTGTAGSTGTTTTPATGTTTTPKKP